MRIKTHLYFLNGKAAHLLYTMFGILTNYKSTKSTTRIKTHLYFLNGKEVFRREDTGRVSLSGSLLGKIFTNGLFAG